MKYEKIFLIANPIAGGGSLKRIQKVEEILKTKNILFNTLLTKKRGDAEQFSKNIAEKYKGKSILVIGAGGDGTYNEIVNGLAFSDVALAILPMGTTSVLAKELNIPKNLPKAVEFAINGKAEKVHLGKIKSKEKQRLFILMAGIGFDGYAVHRVRPERKIFLKKIAYIMAGIKTLLREKPEKLEITNGQKKSAYSVVIAKASCYGGNFKIAPDIDLREPYFGVFLSKTSSRLELALQIIGVVFKRHLKMKGTDYFHSNHLKIRGDAHVQIDGDYFGKTPVEIKIVKNALNLVFPLKYQDP
ncbi:diacylglycerol/lipid kinase family protein [Thermodesulfovibrio hydrogeniphilus]